MKDSSISRQEVVTIDTPEGVQLVAESPRIRLTDLSRLCEHFSEQLQTLRKRAVRPDPAKTAPVIASTQLAEMCGIDRARLNYLVSKGELPEGELNGRARTFSLEQAQVWAKAMPGFIARPADADGAILAITTLKGGSTKTTTTMCLGQALTLLGRKVLLVDLDPQASLSELAGVMVETEITEEDTALPYIEDPDNSSLRDVIRKTYWNNMDIIPAHTGLFAAEFHIPGTLMKNSHYRFFDLLNQGLAPLKKEYDYILLDTAPSLSYLNINALMAADSLVMPIVPEGLDILSSMTFWTLLRDFSDPIETHYNYKKEYDFISVLLAKVDNQKGATFVARQWAQGVYGNWVHPIEIPRGAAMTTSSMGISTVFDMKKEEVAAKTLGRVRDPLFAYAQWIDQQYSRNWLQDNGTLTPERKPSRARTSKRTRAA